MRQMAGRLPVSIFPNRKPSRKEARKHQFPFKEPSQVSSLLFDQIVHQAETDRAESGAAAFSPLRAIAVMALSATSASSSPVVRSFCNAAKAPLSLATSNIFCRSEDLRVG